MRRTLFVDTNILLQYQDLHAIPWRELSLGDSLLIVIPRAVVREIDKLKYQGNARRANRSRLAAALFRKILSSPDGQLVLVDNNPFVECQLAGRISASAYKEHDLNPGIPDESIVAEAIEWNNRNDEAAIVVTNDTGLLLTAADHGVESIIPPEEWRLPQESDESSKRINELSARVSALESEVPKITIEFSVGGNTIEHAHTLSFPSYSSLSPDDLNKLHKELIAHYPLVEIRNSSISIPPKPKESSRFEWIVPQESDLKNYETQYRKWTKRVRRLFASLPDQLSIRDRTILVQLRVENCGGAPARSIEVAIKVDRGLLLPPDFDADTIGEMTKCAFPQPPQAPQAKWVDTSPRSTGLNLDSASRLNSYLSNLESLAPREPGHFYWKGKRPKVTSMEQIFECSSFSHHQGTEIFDANILLPRLDDSSSLTLSCRVIADNLQTETTASIKILLKPEFQSALESARKLMNPSSGITLRIIEGDLDC